jgi:hypothetical protein
MEGRRSSLAPGLTRRVRTAFVPAGFSIVLGASLLGVGCASTDSGSSLRGEVVDSRTSMGYASEPRYFVTVECHEATGAFSRLTLEVSRDDWMRFHSGGAEVCVLPHFGGFRLARCN